MELQEPRQGSRQPAGEDVNTRAQRWKKKMAAADAPHVLIFHSCAIFCFCFHMFHSSCLPFFVQFWAFLLILHDFELFCTILSFFAHILCNNFSDSKF